MPVVHQGHKSLNRSPAAAIRSPLRLILPVPPVVNITIAFGDRGPLALPLAFCLPCVSLDVLLELFTGRPRFPELLDGVLQASLRVIVFPVLQWPLEVGLGIGATTIGH
jgi:hypothetical protein